MTTGQRATDLKGRAIFLSASIPNSDRWAGRFDPLEITDAVVACARVIWGAGGKIVTAAHPTIAPLLWFTATEIERPDNPLVIIYHSEVFADVLPEATQRFAMSDVALVRGVAAADGETKPDPRLAPRSLEALRTEMLTHESPAAAVFIGGMEGITDEAQLVSDLLPHAPRYAFGAPGGAAESLDSKCGPDLRHDLRAGNVYPTLARAVVEDLGRSL